MNRVMARCYSTAARIATVSVAVNPAATLASYHQDDAVPQGAAEVDENETGPLARSRGCHISSRCLV